MTKDEILEIAQYIVDERDALWRDTIKWLEGLDEATATRFIRCLVAELSASPERDLYADTQTDGEIAEADALGLAAIHCEPEDVIRAVLATEGE